MNIVLIVFGIILIAVIVEVVYPSAKVNGILQSCVKGWIEAGEMMGSYSNEDGTIPSDDKAYPIDSGDDLP